MGLDALGGLLGSPVSIFTLMLLASLLIPPIFERLRLPGLVGLLAAGVLLGPSGLQLLDPKAETVVLLSDIGKIYLMFVAGLEIDLKEFRKTRNRSLSFGGATFLIPLLFGIAIGRLFGFEWISAVLIGSLLASHTLLGYPIVQRLGVAQAEAVTVTVGATIFTDIAALLVLAICVSISAGEFSWLRLAVQMAALVVYAVIVLFGFRWAGRRYFRQTGDDQGSQFLFTLLAVFLAAVGAQVIQIEGIIGAFLAGLAVNDVLGKGAVKEKVEFVGGVLFIPFFFIDMGLLLNLPAFVSTLSRHLALVSAVVLGLLASKLLAVLVVRLRYGYRWSEAMVMWSLSMPQVAATLAAALVGRQAGLLTDAVFNTVIVLMLVTSVLGPLLTQRFAKRLTVPDINQSNRPVEPWEPPYPAAPPARQDFAVLVPVYNPTTEARLIEVGALLARQAGGKLAAIAIAQAHLNPTEAELTNAIALSRQRLQQANTISHSLGITAEPILRIDSDVGLGISRAAREHDTQLIVMGYGETASLQARLFGSVIAHVFTTAHCPVAIIRLQVQPQQIRQILVPIRDLAPSSLRLIQFARYLATALGAAMTLVHVCPAHTTEPAKARFRQRLYDQLQDAAASPDRYKVVPHGDIAQVILRVASQYDLVVLRATRRMASPGLTVSDMTTEVLRRFDGSVVLFGEPEG
ncbi:cation:proton antiporter [Romeria aff. gracilis LEGE 07310]|uniref:Cation:proton antiporter n=1 Tax=Vasconcelosia minhoensis LEGE 07310 TaxID=915328 RepID=A0A8J7A8W9_9CYAN|nr:cation:proton antiporter [Romeria gracilis]MBE9078220.1 cation:proton antiporter [Romeria aff. gracilis LEGE 07310]